MTTMPESFFGWVTFLLHQYGDVLLKGACVTLLLAIVGTLIGCVIGLVVGIIQTIPEDQRQVSPKGSCKSDSIGLECLCRTFPRYADDRTGYGSILWCYEYV